ncbi:MAG TPA: response regulator transcription factor [Solirubrobacteraceae bacterium]|nr:response regulator transcription factor [Solirubrobacteraceae bacterium]
MRVNNDSPAGDAPAKPKVVIADDDALVCAMLESRLEGDFDCVGRGADAMDAVALVEAHRPDVAILDVMMPAGGALFATQAIAERCPETAIVILSCDQKRSMAFKLMDAGAESYLCKDVDPLALPIKLRAAMASKARQLAASA